MQTYIANPKRTRRGFTLLEALVAVIGVSILSVGLSTIFSSISKTVTAGRRVSAINTYAAVVERVMREDFASMTRDGFLVIRNEYALNDAVPLSPDAYDNRRPRRIDEIMFFARGQFESARAPLDGDFVARGNSARIYYGHGQERLEGTTGFQTPFLDETNEISQLRHGLSVSQDTIGEINPNFYASDWTLLRHVTLLKVPQLHPAGQPGPLGLSSASNASLRRFQDNQLQIAGQPAAAGVFRVETAIGRPFDDNSFDAGTDGSFSSFSIRGEVVSPLFESGIVDIATTSLSEIKRRVTTIYANERFGPQSSDGSSTQSLRFFAGTPSDVFLNNENYDARQGIFTNVPRYNPRDTVYAMSPSEFLDYRYGIQDPDYVIGDPFVDNTPFATKIGADDNVSGLQNLVHVQQSWMSDAFPGRSNERIWEGSNSWQVDPSYSASWRGEDPRVLPGSSSPPPYPSDRSLYEDDLARTRMRYEPTPPGYNADVFSPSAAEGYSAIQHATYRADQQVIGASQFIPQCTEFIVEWSLGEYDFDTNQVIWYGHDPDGVYAPDRAGVVQRLRPDVARPSPFMPGTFDGTNQADVRDQRDIEKHLLADLINGLVTENDTRDERFLRNVPLRYPLTHYFGYADPRAVPVDNDGDDIADGYDMNEDGVPDDIDGDGDSSENEWPWPKMVRVTMSFADPIDQTTEETFQFIIEIPDGRGI